jgi:hypothetical protein
MCMENLPHQRDSIIGPSSPWRVAIPNKLPRSNFGLMECKAIWLVDSCQRFRITCYLRLHSLLPYPRPSTKLYGAKNKNPRVTHPWESGGEFKSRTTKQVRFSYVLLAVNSPLSVYKQTDTNIHIQSSNRPDSFSFNAYLKQNDSCSKPISNMWHTPASILVE